MASTEVSSSAEKAAEPIVETSSTNSVKTETAATTNPPKTESPAIPSQTSGIPTWPTLGTDHPLTKLAGKLEDVLKKANHNEVYGLTLVNPPDFHTNLILQKFLRANANNVELAATQLLATLKWRQEFRPLETIKATHSQERFGGLGYVIELENVPDTTSKQIATFNLYGSVKDPKLTFEDIEGFLKWRVALMEIGLQKLNLKNATEPIPDYGTGEDPYQAIQVHDYMQVSFIRQNSYTKAASKKTIEVFKDYYPETLSRKFFVNVPVVMGWMFNAVSLVLSKETVKKFIVLSYGNTLNASLGDGVPVVYGGKGPDLDKIGEGPILKA